MTAQEFKYTNFMTLEEWKEWKKEFESFWGKDCSTKSFFIKRKDYSFFRLINSSFLLRGTDKGYYYWDKISQRTKPVV